MVAMGLLTAIILEAWGFDYWKPEFWSNPHRFSEPRCVRRLAIEVSSISDVATDASKCGAVRPFGDGKWSANCRLPEREAEAVLSSLKSKYRILFYQQFCRKGKPAPELDYKRENLAQEAKELGLHTSTVPALFGLLEAQRLALDELIMEREISKLTALTIMAVIPGTQGDDRDVPLHEEPPEGFQIRASEHPWATDPVPACLQVQRYELTFQDRESQLTARTALELFADPYDEPDCPLGAGAAPTTLYLSHRPLLGHEFLPLDGLRSIHLTEPILSPGRAPDDERATALSIDRDTLSEKLRKAPHIEAMILSVLGSLNERAPTVSKLRRGTLIQIHPRR